MRILSVIMLAFTLSLSAKTVSQTITFKGNNVPLDQLFLEVEKQTGYYVVYSKEEVINAKPVSVIANNLPVEEFISTILNDQPFGFSIEGNTVSIRTKVPVPKFKDAEDSGDYRRQNPPPVTGIIRDSEGNPLQGVNVVVKGTKRGITTDAQGKFSIEAKENDVLVISSIGYNAREVKVTSVNVPHTVALEKSVSELDEVQYIAYGTQTKRFSVGNVTTVTSKDIEKQPVNNPLLALTGRVPGLQVMQANGVPGGGITIRIQGRNNLDNRFVGSDPFIVIDGVPYASQNLSTFLGGGINPAFKILGSSSNDGINSQVLSGNPLAFINPADIESISVLRDADATAIYGSRAANGAILITTKKGKAGTMKVDVNVQQGWGKVPKKMDLLNSQQYMEMRWEAKRNDGRPVSARDYDLRGVWDTTQNTDWQEILIGGTASFTRATAGVSGGTNQLRYLISGTYGRETSVFPGDVANTFGSLHFNVAASSANQRFNLQLGGNYMININKLPAEDYTPHALNFPPIAPSLRQADGSLNWAPDPLTGMSTWWNPLSRQYNLFDTKTHNLVANASIGYRLLPSLEMKTAFGFTSTTSDQFTAPLDETEKPEDRLNRLRIANFSFNTSRTWIVEPQLVFRQKWAHHDLNVLVGGTFQYQDNNGRAFGSQGQSSDLLLRDMLAGTSLYAAGMDVNEYRYNAVFGRISYTAYKKYLVNLSARRDGSSRFGPNSQFNNFGAVGLGWIFSEEALFKRFLSLVSFAKLRVSYGSTGNDQIGNYRFMSLYSSLARTISYQGLGETTPDGLPNSLLEWELTRKLQGGIDIGFWKDKVVLTVNHFRNRSSNSLTSIEMPIITGFDSYITNLPALIQNTGWEFSLSSELVNAKMFKWTNNINLTISNNKLIAFPGLESSPIAERLVIGQPLNTIRTYSFHGVDPMTGQYLFSNQFGDPTNNPSVKDRNAFINTLPRWYAGFQHTVNYKKLSLEILLQFVQQYAEDVAQLNLFPGLFSIGNTASTFIYGNHTTAIMDRWQKPGDHRHYQRFSSVGLGTSTGNLFFKNASYARLKNVSVSYQLANTVLQKIKMQELRVYANAQNVLTLTRYNGLDPETRSLSSLPPLRMITIGIKAIF